MHAETERSMKIDWGWAIFAGLVGTVAFDVLGLLLTGKWWDIPGLLGMKLGAGLAGGVVPIMPTASFWGSSTLAWDPRCGDLAG